MAPTSAAMELKVLINILTQGQALPQLLNQTKQLSAALTQLQTQAGAASGVSNAAAGAKQAAVAISGIGTAGEAAASGIAVMEGAVNKLVGAMKFLTGGFLAFQSVRFLKGLADEAARTEVLGTVLHVVALNSGYTADAIDKVDKKVQSLGITAAASRESLTQFLQAGLKLDFAPKLARAAQDLAVIAGKDSSSTFSRMIINIQQLDTLGLRLMGIVTDRTLAEQKYKQLHTDITGVLNKRQMQEALMVEVLEKAKLLEGTYASAMDNVGKQLTSLTRLSTNLRVELGDALLPAYSELVRVITTTYERLILIAQEFTANRERSQEWADTVTKAANAVSELVIVLAKHLDQIIYAIELYAAFRLSMLALAGIAGFWGWVATVIGFLTRLRLVMASVQTTGIALSAAITALGASSAKEAVKILMAAEAEAAAAKAQAAMAATAPGAAAGLTTVGTAATTTTAAVEGLGLAWGVMLASLAIPAIGYIIYKAVQGAREFDEKPFLERASIIRRESQPLGFSGVTPESGGGTVLPLTSMFEEWKRNNPELVAGLKEDSKLMDEFNRQINQFEGDKALKGFAAAIAQVTSEVKAATTAQEEMFKTAKDEGKRVSPAERKAAADLLTDAQQRLANLKDAMEKSFEAMDLSPSTKELEAQIKLVDKLGEKLSKVKADDTKGRDDLSAAEAELAVEKKKLEAMQKNHAERLKIEQVGNPQRQRDELARGSYMAGIQEAGVSAEALMTATKQLFGETAFTDEGIMSAGFNKAFSSFEIVLKSAGDMMERDGKILPAMADQVRKGITAIGQAAQTPLDLKNLQKIGPEIAKLGVQGTGPLFQQAIALAQQGVRQTRLAPGAPIVSERLEIINREEDAQAEKDRRRQTKLKTMYAAESDAMESQYKQGLVLLDDYFNARFDRIGEEGKEELRLQQDTIERLKREEAAAEDPKQIAAFKQQRIAAQNQIPAIQGRIELEQARVRIQQAERRTQLEKDLQQAVIAQRVAIGGVEAALEQVNFQLEEERKKYAELGNPLSDQLLALKRLTAEYEIYRQERERAFQVEQSALAILEEELALSQTRIEVSRAQDQAAVAQGRMTEATAERRNNARIREEMGDNRAAKIQQEMKLEALRAKNAEDLAARSKVIQAEYLAGHITRVEAERQFIELQNQQTLAIMQSENAVNAYDVAYANMAASIQTASKKIRDAIETNLTNTLTDMIMHTKTAAEAWKDFANSLTREFVAAMTKMMVQKSVVQFMSLFGGFGKGGGGGSVASSSTMGSNPMSGVSFKAAGGVISGPGTGTSDSIPAMVSAGEHIMPASKAAQWLPLLEGIRLGKLSPAFALGGVVALQSIAGPSLIPRRYASGGVVIADAGAASVTPGGGGPSHMVVSLHPDAMNMTLREWLEHEVVRQQGRR